MPQLPNAPNVIRVAVQGTIGTQPWANIFHVAYAGTPITQGNLTNFLTSFGSAYNTAFTSHMSTGTDIRSIKGEDLGDPGYSQAQITTSYAGGAAGGALPNSIACVVTWRVNYRWRGGHPRTYLPCGTTLDLAQGHTWTAGFESAMETAAESFRQAVAAITVGTHTFGMICLRYYNNHELLAVPLGLPIWGSTVHSRADSQRRRLGKEPI